MIHYLKIYPEHFSAVLTGVKRAELRNNDRDFKVGDILHLMETPKGSCLPTGEFINAVVTHIADVREWLPGYVMLSIERESGYAAPQLPQPAVTKWPAPHKNNQSQGWQVCPEFLHQIREQIGDDEENYDLCPSLEMVEAVLLSAAMLQGAENSESRCTIQTAPALDSSPKIAEWPSGNSPVILDDVRRMDWLVSKTVDVREPMVYGSHSLFWSQTITDEEDDYHATKLREQIDAAMAAENAAAPQQEVK